MFARVCSCARPRVFEVEEGRCHRCGYVPAPVRIAPSTWRLALAIAEYALGIRRGEQRPGKRAVRDNQGSRDAR